MDPNNQLPQWAPRVTKAEIRRLYDTDARGIYDEDLINEVGYGLLARCDSFVVAVGATLGELPCPRCCEPVKREEVMRCACGWELRWDDYFKTIQHKQLSGAEPVLKQFREFIAEFPRARTPREKMMLIDRLIHGFHWYYKDNSPTRPVAINLIEGRLSDVVEFLDGITYGENTPGTRENREEWNRNIGVYRSWGPPRGEVE